MTIHAAVEILQRRIVVEFIRSFSTQPLNKSTCFNVILLRYYVTQCQKSEIHKLHVVLLARNNPKYYLLDCLHDNGLDRTYHAHRFIFSFTFYRIVS